MIRDLSTTLALLSDPSLAAPFPELHHALIAFDRCVDSARAKGGKVDSVRLAGGWADHQVGFASLAKLAWRQSRVRADHRQGPMGRRPYLPVGDVMAIAALTQSPWRPLE